LRNAQGELHAPSLQRPCRGPSAYARPVSGGQPGRDLRNVAGGSPRALETPGRVDSRGSCEPGLACRVSHDSGAYLPRRVMAHVLGVTALKVSDLVVLKILMEADNMLLQAWAWGNVQAPFRIWSWVLWSSPPASSRNRCNDVPPSRSGKRLRLPPPAAAKVGTTSPPAGIIAGGWVMSARACSSTIRSAPREASRPARPTAHCQWPACTRRVAAGH
jgi:hypothetical protein